jgi:peroxiredoxin
MRRVSEWIGLAAVGAMALCLTAPTGADAGDGLQLRDTAGTLHRIGAQPGKQATVYYFLSNSCPMVARYSYRVRELVTTFGPKGVAFFGVNSNALATRDETAAVAAKRSYNFPVLLDPRQQAADRWSVVQVPYVIVVDNFGRTRYRGIIDDNKAEDLAKRHYLRDALTQLLAGQPVRLVETQPDLGCLIERPLTPEAGATVTYAEHVAPILQKRCVNCHRPGEVAPFSFLTYEESKRWARNIAHQTRRRVMPPWQPVGRGLYRGERVMTEAEIDLLQQWAKAGAPAGDLSKAPPAPEYLAGGWAFGEPDLILEAEEYELGPDGPDEYRCFVLPTNLPEDQWVVAVEHQPGNRAVVHHLIAYVDGGDRSVQLDARDPKPGYRSNGTGPGFQPVGEMGGWAPGVQPEQLPPGVGRFLPKGGKIVLEVHYHRNGHTEKDKTRLGLYFAKKPIHQQWRWFELINPFFQIPAGAKAHVVTQRRRVKRNVTAHAVIPHMHLLGKQIKVTAQFPDGTSKVLVDIQDWDFNWQDFYYFKQPVKLPKDTVLELECVYDNSAENLNNPNDPPKVVGWGEQTTDEMALAFVSITIDGEDLAPGAGGK